MSGFVVEVCSSFDSSVPMKWLAEDEGTLCVVSDRRSAKIFDNTDTAWQAAYAYRNDRLGVGIAYMTVRTSRLC